MGLGYKLYNKNKINIVLNFTIDNKYFNLVYSLFNQFPKFFSLGFATKTGPTEKIMKNSRMSLTIIGHGLTSVQPITFNAIDIINGKTQNNKRTTTVKVMF